MTTYNKLKKTVLCIGALCAYSALPAHGMEDNALFNATRLELEAGRSHRGDSVQGLRAQGWVGQDYNRFAWKAEGSRERSTLEEAEVQALYARYLAPFWELQTGVRVQSQPASKTYAVLGVRGIAPYAFDVDLAMFVRSDGRLFTRTRVEYDVLWTNRIVFRPFVFVDWSASKIENENIRQGTQGIEAGLDMRYEFSRAFAPYIELGRIKRSALNGKAIDTSLRLGVRLLF